MTFAHGPMPLRDLTGAVGNTPLIRIRQIGREFSGVEIYAKHEGFNPGGSVKDRPALQMIQDALAAGSIDRTKSLIDSTSGNTGIAYSWIGAALGLKVTLVMPESVSRSRKQITKAFGAEQVFSDPMDGSDGAIRLCRNLVAENPEKYFYPDQYSNHSNPKAHYLGTGREIWEQTQGRVTHFVAGIGTSGTVMGTGRRLKECRAGIQVYAVEPAEPMHGLEGLKHMPTSIVPAIYQEAELDEKLSITTDAGWDLAERLGREEGLFVGHSAGAALSGALVVAARLHQRGERGVVVTLFPDRSERYFEAGRL